MVYAIVALTVLIFVTLAAHVLAAPNRRRGIDFGELTPSSVDELALKLRKTTAGGRAPSRTLCAFDAARACRRIVKDDRDGVEIEDCEKLFAEKYHAIASRLKHGFGALAALPHAGGEARVATLARALLSSSKICRDGQALKETLVKFVTRTPLDYAETMSLPLATEAACAELWRDIARKLLELARSRRRQARERRRCPTEA